MGGRKAKDCDFARVLILCDKYGCNLDTLLRKHLVCQEARFMVVTIIKPGADINGVMKDIEDLTKSFRKTDYVAFARSNDFRRRKYLQFRCLVDKIRQCGHINVVMNQCRIFWMV